MHDSCICIHIYVKNEFFLATFERETETCVYFPLRPMSLNSFLLTTVLSFVPKIATFALLMDLFPLVSFASFICFIAHDDPVLSDYSATTATSGSLV